MDNSTILDNRWKYTNDKLKDYLKIYKKLNLHTQDKIQDIFNDVNISYLDLNKPISTYQRKKLLRIIEQWEQLNMLTGYFKYRVEQLILKKYITNEEMLHILLWGAYVNERKQLDEYENILFLEIGKELYKQAYDEIKPKKTKKHNLTWEFIWFLLCSPNNNGNKWIEYVEASALTNAEEIKKEAVIQLQQGKKLSIRDSIFKNIINKQQNRYLCINDNKYSGALDNQIIEIANQSFIKAGQDTADKDLQIRFIAEIDKRTTKMCESMNNMLFYVNDWNTFQRYSHSDSKIVNYKVFGLVSGVNLPPITNHFHYCRSTLTYLIDMPREKINKNLQNWNEKAAIKKWLSSDFYYINQKMYNDIKLTKEEKRLVKDLYRGLNKQPYYKSKNNEMIVRVLEVDNDTLNTIISQHQIGQVYKTKAFESYSLKDGYNSNANVYFYVRDSKKARSMLEYNPIEKEAEVLYQYGIKFVTKDYYTKNGKHYFLLEEYDD